MMTRIASLLLRTGLFAALLSAAGCAYRLGAGTRSLPGGYRQMSIPMFKNRSQDVGAEAVFTQALQQEFIRSKVGRIVAEPMAEVRIEGEVVSVDYTASTKLSSGDKSSGLLPDGTVLASRYGVVTKVVVRVIRRSDGEKLWEDTFTNERSYPAPFVTVAGVNTVNPLYNQSARAQNLESVAGEMMSEAHSRITENF